MKTVAFYLLLLIACLPVPAQARQTNLDSRGYLTVFSDIMQKSNQYAGNQDIRTIIIDRHTTQLPENAFSGTGVRNLNFECPSSIRVIPSGAFSENYNLDTVQLFDSRYPASLLTIGQYAFAGCSKLQRIRLPPSLKEIQEGAFFFTGITRLYIPDSVEQIGHSILYVNGTEPVAIESVRLPANINIQQHGNPFYQAYVDNGKRAGVYFRSNTTWVYRQGSQDISDIEYYAAP